MAHELALDDLGAALLALPGPWEVLRDVGSSEGGNGVGVSFIALHPKRGIALVDLAPASLNASVTWLRIILIHAGGGVFTVREPPITSVLLSHKEIAHASSYVEASFAKTLPCAIPGKDWPNQAIAALTAEHHLMPLAVSGKRKSNPKRRSTLGAFKPANSYSRAERQEPAPADEQTTVHKERGLARDAAPSNALHLDVPLIEAPAIHPQRPHLVHIALPNPCIPLPQVRSEPQAGNLSPGVTRPSETTIGLSHPRRTTAIKVKAPSALPAKRSADPLPSIPSEALPRPAIAVFPSADAQPRPIDAAGVEAKPEIVQSRTTHTGVWPIGIRLGTLKITGLWPIGPRLGTLKITGLWPIGPRLGTLKITGLWPIDVRLGTLKMGVDQSLITRVIREECALVLRNGAAFVLTHPPRWSRVAPAILALLLGVFSPSIFRSLELGGNSFQWSSEDPSPQTLGIRDAEALAAEEAAAQGPKLKQPDDSISGEAFRTQAKSEEAAKMPRASGRAISKYSGKAARPHRARSKNVHKKHLVWKLPGNARPYDGPSWRAAKNAPNGG